MDRQFVLIIEDEQNIIELVKYNLERYGFLVRAEMNGEKGLELALRDKPLLILLDLMLPGVSGIEICKTLRNNYKTKDIPVIMLTAKSEEADIILGLELGADDYVTKPFSPRQLLARVKAVLRRFSEKPPERLIRVGTLEIDTGRHLVAVNKKPVDLTSREYSLLKFLSESSGRVLSRESILNHVWGLDAAIEVDSRVVDKHIGELRKKLGTAGQWILTVKSFGYRFDPEAGEDTEEPLT